MAGVAFDFDVRGLVEVGEKLGYLEKWRETGRIAEAAAVYLENATKERIAATKTAPDGTPWAPWSEGYAAQRGKAQSLLLGQGDLRDSVQSYATLTEARVGSNLVYSGTHQFGASQGDFGETSRGAPIPFGDIPARPYLGVSDEDEHELQNIVNDRIRRLLQ